VPQYAMKPRKETGNISQLRINEDGLRIRPLFTLGNVEHRDSSANDLYAARFLPSPEIADAASRAGGASFPSGSRPLMRRFL
jgi:hypothetical protein